MIAPDGTEWLPVAAAARRVRVREDVVYRWEQRGQVRSHRVLRRLYVCVNDVTAAELRWRRRVSR